MNSDTGQIYRTKEEIEAARKRGEPLEPIGPRVAEEDKHYRFRRVGGPHSDGDASRRAALRAARHGYAR